MNALKASRWMIAAFLSVGLGVAPLVGAAETKVTDGLTFEAKRDGTYKLIDIDRTRRYSVIDLTEEALRESCGEGIIVSELSTEEKAVNVGEDKEDLYLFGKVFVKRLVLPGSIEKVETVSFTDIKGLEVIEFSGRVPSFEEEKGWFFYEDDWRNKLQYVVFHDEVAPERLNSVLSGVPIIEFAPTARFEGELLDKNSGRAKGLLAKAGALTRLVVPYSLAVRLDIPWRTYIARSPLADKEVVSQPSANESGADGTDGSAVCLLNCDEDGEISDAVTDIRLDALQGSVEERIYLPTLFRRFVDPYVDLSRYEGRLWLKRDTVQFYPDITQRIADTRKADQLFPTIFKYAQVTATSPYQGLTLRAVAVNELGENIGKEIGSDDPTLHGLAYNTSLSLEMGKRFVLFTTMALPTGQHVPVFIDGGRNEAELFFRTPEQKPWFLSALCWMVGIMLGLAFVIGAILVLFRDSWLDRVVARPFLEAPWWKQALFALSLLLLVLGAHGVLANLVQVYLWAPVVQYVNNSFISSLVISITTTLLQMGLGLLKGISIQPFGIGVDLEHVIEPCTDLLARVGWVSWISTGVLAFLRVLSEMLREFGTVLWVFTGALVTMLALPFNAWQRLQARWPWFRAAVGTLFFLTLGLPVFLACCSWLSLQLMTHAGNTFNDALATFKCLVDAFSFQAFLSLDGIQSLTMLLTDAMTELTAAAITYVMTKVFDCFLVPIGLLWLSLRVLKKFGVVKDLNLRTFLEKDRFQKRFLPEREAKEPALPAVDAAVPLPAPDTAIDSGTAAKPVAEPVPASDVAVNSGSAAKPVAEPVPASDAAVDPGSEAKPVAGPASVPTEPTPGVTCHSPKEENNHVKA